MGAVRVAVSRCCAAIPPGTWCAVGRTVRGILIVLLVAALYFELVLLAGSFGQGRALDVVSLLASLPNLSIISAALDEAGVRNTTLDGYGHLTLFAPTDDAFNVIFEQSLLTCEHDFYRASPCTSQADLLSATNLKTIVLNHFVRDIIKTENLSNGLLLQSIGDAVTKVTKSPVGLLVGDAQVVVPDILASNGIIHVINGSVLGSVNQKTLLSTDVSINSSAVLAASKLGDFHFLDEKKRQEMAKEAQLMNIPAYQQHRALVGLPDGSHKKPPVLLFDPSLNTRAAATSADSKFRYPQSYGVKRPKSDEDLAYMTVSDLGYLLKNRKVTATELVNIFTERLKRYDPVLKVVVTYTTELAKEQAKAADDLIKRGRYQGPLHGIPYGLKDTIAVPGYRTTWGSSVFKDQVIDEEAWVYKKLQAAGAVLIAKLACGSLAWGDIWFGGRTRNPWNIAEFSSGSSSGPAAATSAGLVPFAIGSETSGSITIPASKTGATAFRPTFGIVGRSGVMTLSESLDKLGPFCRSASDCAIILDQIRGKDPDDYSSKDIRFRDPFGIEVSRLTVGYLPDADIEVVNVLASKRVKMVPLRLTYSVPSAQTVMNTTVGPDMLSHFDHWQRAGMDDEYENQDAWPVSARRARMISAVDYIQAQRVRGILVQEVQKSLSAVDAFIGSVIDGEKIALGNLVGMPVAVVLTGLENVQDTPGSLHKSTVSTGIYGAPFQDAEVLALAMAFQAATGYHLLRPPINNLASLLQPSMEVD